MIITCFYLNTNYELNKKWESGIRGIIMFMIIIFIGSIYNSLYINELQVKR